MYGGYIALIIISIIIAISGVILLLGKDKKENTVSIIASGVCMLAITALLMCGIIAPMQRVSAKRELAEFEGTRDLCEQLINDGDYNENIGLTGTIIEVNKWLMKAQSSIKTWGYNSPYCGLGIEDLKPITVRGDKR